MRNFTDNDYRNLKDEIENFKSKNPTLITNPAITFCFAGDKESQNYANQVMNKFHNDGITIQTSSAFNFGETPQRNFTVSQFFDESIMVEIHPEF